MRFLLATAFAIASLSACASTGTTAPEAPGEKLETSVSKSRGSGPDANVKRETAVNTEAGDPAVTQPPEKGGPQARGALCYVNVSNNTRWYVQLYISGDFIGTLRPWADYSTTVTEGSGTLYGKAPFDDGSYSWWGPQGYNCYGQNIAWTMHP
jgi:hypothetical protein